MVTSDTILAAATPVTVPHFAEVSHLSGGRRKRYAYLARMQDTRIVITPVHTTDEYAKFSHALSSRGEFGVQVAVKSLNFKELARWWNRGANGSMVFYKLPTILEAQHKKWSDRKDMVTTLALTEG